MLDAIAGHQKGLGGAAYIPETDEVVTCGEDGRVCIRHADALEKELREIPRLEACPVHCVASNPKRGQFAVGDKQKGVYVSIPALTPSSNDTCGCNSSMHTESPDTTSKM